MNFEHFNSIYAIDDSGDLFSPIVIEGGQVRIKPPKSRWASLGSVRFSQGSIHEFVRDWIHLQSEIQYELKLPYLPAIHMRLMWGKDPDRRPPCYKGKKRCKTKNPYRKVSSEKILQWVISSLEILKKYRKANVLSIRPQALDIEEWVNSFGQETIDEMEFLVKTIGKKTAEPFLKMLHSPYLAMIADLLADIQIYENHRKVAVVVDNAADILGFEVDEELIRQHTKTGLNLTFIGRVDTLGFDANQFPLLQASDVVAYFYRRVLEGDPVSRDLANSYLDMRPPKVARKLSRPWNKKAIRNHNTQLVARFILRYQHAYKIALGQKRSKELLDLVVSPEEFAARIKDIPSKKKPVATLHVSVLKEPLEGRKPVVDSYYNRR